MSNEAKPCGIISILLPPKIDSNNLFLMFTLAESPFFAASVLSLRYPKLFVADFSL